MLKPKALTQVLGQVNTSSTLGTLLLNKEGVLLAYSGYGENNACVSAAIASSVWATFEKHGHSHDDVLSDIIVQCEGGNVAIRKVANLLVCVCAEYSVPLGMLKAKLTAVAQYLEGPLSQVANI